jgi:hypothetical protein
MLLQNGSLFAAQPLTRIGGVDFATNTVPWNRGGLQYNFWFGSAGFVAYYGIPVGYAQPPAWILPQESGGLYINKGDIAGTGGITVCALVQGRRLTVSTINGTGTVTTPGFGAKAAINPTITCPSTVTISGASGGATFALTINGNAVVTPVVGAVAAVASSIPIVVVFTAAGSGLVDLVSTINGTAGVTIISAAGFAATAGVNGTATVTTGGAASGIITSLINIPGLPTAQDIAFAVWGANLEAGYSAQELVRAMIAVAVNKSVIVPGSPVHVKFRDILDEMDRVDATMGGATNSERVDVTLDLE